MQLLSFINFYQENILWQDGDWLNRDPPYPPPPKKNPKTKIIKQQTPKITSQRKFISKLNFKTSIFKYRHLFSLWYIWAYTLIYCLSAYIKPTQLPQLTPVGSGNSRPFPSTISRIISSVLKFLLCISFSTVDFSELCIYVAFIL